MDLTEIMEIVCEQFPEKTIVDITSYENEDHQSYKSLYERIQDSIKSLQEENVTVSFNIQQREKELAAAEKEIWELKRRNALLSESLIPAIDKMKQYCGSQIFVSNIRTDFEEAEKGFNLEEFYKTMSEHPGVYGGFRPSWFTPLETPLSKKTVQEKNKRAANESLLRILHFWKKAGKRIQSEPEEVANEYDKNRKDAIVELLRSDCSNTEKYLKYFLMTPGLDKEYMKTLEGASELNIDARLLIALLEQPNEKFNRKIIENYVSRLHKGTEYNLKQELAEELLKGKWYIESDVNGEKERYQLFPVSVMETMIGKLDSIIDFIKTSNDAELSANLAESSANQSQEQTTEDVSVSIENESISETPSFVDYDEE
ncbi:hypothetical protein ACTQ56_00785 [[Clostridium] aminophilum]|uniref:hypothetical protein n=1 Tax=[Clostridium] aminophilum TaxID=1526 RepID=UPI003F9DFA2C